MYACDQPDNQQYKIIASSTKCNEMNYVALIEF